MGFYSLRVCSPLWRVCVGANGQGVHPDITEYLGWEDLPADSWWATSGAEFPGVHSAGTRGGFIGNLLMSFEASSLSSQTQGWIKPLGKVRVSWEQGRCRNFQSLVWRTWSIDKLLLNSRELWKNHLVKSEVCLEKKLGFFSRINHFQLLMVVFLRELPKFFGVVWRRFLSKHW